MSSYITPLDTPRGWRYGSETVIYTERFIDGRLLCASFVANGVPVPAQHESHALPAFDLVIDGESLAFGWEYVDFRTGTDARGLSTGTLVLRHGLKPITLEIVTAVGEHGFFNRQLFITNTAEASVGLTAVTPLRGVLWTDKGENKTEKCPRDGEPFSVGYFRDVDWSMEGNFVWQDCPLNTTFAQGSRRGRSGFRHPFFVLRNNHYGGYFFCDLAWSANWRAEVTPEQMPMYGSFHAGFAIMPEATPPMRVIAPGETVASPVVHFGMCHDDFDATLQRWHAYLRSSVLKRVGDGAQPVIFNHWGYMQHELSEERLRAEIDIAHEVGAELFVVDAGWYGNANTNWWNTTGNWQAGDRLPNDLFPVFDYARGKGMQCGLWVEIESAGTESRLATEHPDWFITRYGHTVQRVLDLAKPVVRDYVQSEIIRIIDRYQLDMFRLDYNLDAFEGGFNLVDGRQENTLWRHVEAIYAIFDEVGRRYPALQLETCSSGGGRTDLGIVSRFTTSWLSDWMRMPRTMRILNGMSMVLPPDYCDRLFGTGLENTMNGNLDTLLHGVILAHPTLSGITPELATANPIVMAAVKKYVAIYKDFIRPLHRTARVYHHTPVIPGADGDGWCALEYAATDRRRAVAGVFRLVNAEDDSYRLRFRGLDPGLTYRLTTEPDGWQVSLPGYQLMQEGIAIRLDTALTSKLLLLEAEG